VAGAIAPSWYRYLARDRTHRNVSFSSRPDSSRDPLIRTSARAFAASDPRSCLFTDPRLLLRPGGGSVRITLDRQQDLAITCYLKTRSIGPYPGPPARLIASLAVNAPAASPELRSRQLCS